jgi:hypothetical protein
MDVNALLKGTAQQQNPAATTDGQTAELRASRVGQLYTANWKTELVLAGYSFNVTVGGVSSGADVALITGVGNGTIVNSDLPEMAIGTPIGYYHIPLGFTCAIQSNPDTDADEQNIILFADLTKTIPIPIAASSTVETPHNLLDGGPASVSWAMSACHTADIVDPVCTVVLDYATNQAAQVDGSGTVVATLRSDYDPTYPSIFKGPCSVVACWGGTQAVTGICSYNWAEVPIGRFE